MASEKTKDVLFCYPVPPSKKNHVGPKEFLKWAKSDLKCPFGKRA